MTRIILDEGVPKVLARLLREMGIDVSPFPNGMKQLSNGRLLDEIEKQGFDLLLTNDKTMRFQQSLKGRKLAVVSLPTNLRPALIQMLPEIIDAIRSSTPGHFAQMVKPASLKS